MCLYTHICIKLAYCIVSVFFIIRTDKRSSPATLAAPVSPQKKRKKNKDGTKLILTCIGDALKLLFHSFYTCSPR